MSWNMVGRPYSTTDMVGTTIYQNMVLPKSKAVVGVTTGVIFYNDPAFTSLAIRAYATRANAPSVLLATSNFFNKADLLTDNSGYKSVGFTFEPKLMLRGGDTFAFTLFAIGYTGDDNSHIALRQSYPDPQFAPAGLPLNASQADNFPFDICLVGADI